MKFSDIPSRVHFVGIGGIGVSALAQYLFALGFKVTGSDRLVNDRTQFLARAGIKIFIGHSEKNVDDAQLVVRTSAARDDNVEVVSAFKRGIPIALREELLGAIFNSFKTRIAVCGTHGKTTVTAMIHEMLAQCGVDHAAFIGGVYKGNNFYFGKDTVVAEACEYNRSFFNLNPTIAVCTNAEYDHPDCYSSGREIRRAFKQFLANTEREGLVVLPSKLARLAPGQKLLFDDCFKDGMTFNDGKPSFIARYSDFSVPVCLDVAGAHNADNALAALSVGRALGIAPSRASACLKRFCGVDRRWTEYDKGFKVICDYAHHPTEIACSIKTAQSIAKGKVVCLFQPHTYTRTKAFFKEFAACFKYADKVAFLPIYSAREVPLTGVTSQRLAKLASKRGADAVYVESFDAAAEWIKQNTNAPDVVLILGAGDVVDVINLL